MAQRLIVFLKGRRVFGPQPAVGQKQYVVQSVKKINTFLEGELFFFGKDSILGQNINALRQACLQFQHTMITDQIDDDDHASFNTCLQNLKNNFGLHLERIISSYEIDISDDISHLLQHSA